MQVREIVSVDKIRVNKFLIVYVALLFLFAYLYFLAQNLFNGINAFSDAVYFSVVTATTLGFGDIAPKHWFAKFLVSSQVLSSVFLVGFYLNSLSFAQSERIRLNESKLLRVRREQMRDGLDRHISLLIEALKTSNPFIWDKHARHCEPLCTYKNYMAEFKDFLKKENGIIDSLRMKVLLECADQIYDSSVALLPVAADISPEYLMRWSSIVSNIRNLRGQYLNAIKKVPFEGQWPDTSVVTFQLQEILEGALFLSEPLYVIEPM